jgi:hypothetical protein
MTRWFCHHALVLSPRAGSVTTRPCRAEGGGADGRTLASCQQRRRRLTGRTGPGVTFSLEDESIASNALNGRKVRKNARLPAVRRGYDVEADWAVTCKPAPRAWLRRSARHPDGIGARPAPGRNAACRPWSARLTFPDPRAPSRVPATRGRPR